MVLGTRPEIIKLAPIIKRLGTKNHSVIFTGQHYDYQMGMQFIHQLQLPKPNHSLKISKSNPSLQISEIIAKLSKILSREINLSEPAVHRAGTLTGCRSSNFRNVIIGKVRNPNFGCWLKKYELDNYDAYTGVHSVDSG